MRQHRPAVKSVFRAWMYSYAAGLAVVLGIVIGLYAFLDSVIEDQMAATNAVHGRTVRDRMDYELSRMKDIAFRISQDGRLVSYDSCSTDCTRQLVAELKGYGMMSPWLESAAVSIPVLDMVISPEGINSPDDFWSLLSEYRDIGDGSRPVAESGGFAFAHTSDAEHARPVFFYSCGSDVRYPRQEDEIIILIDTGAVEDYLELVGEASGSAIEIQNNRGTILFAYHPADFPDTGNIDITSSLTGTDWTVIISTPRQLYNATVTAIRGISVAILAMLTVAYLTMAIRFSRKNYEPVRKLMEALPVRENSEDGNEYDRIGRSLTNMNDRLERYRLETREGLFLSLLRGDVPEDAESLEEIGLGSRRKGEASLVCFLQSPDEKRRLRIAGALALRDGIRNRPERPVTAVLSDITWAILPIGRDDCSRIIRQLIPSADIRAVVVPVSTESGSLRELADECLASIHPEQGDSTIILPEIRKPAAAAYRIPREEEERVVRAIRQGDTGAVRDNLERLIDDNRRAGLSPAMSSVFLSSLLTLILRPYQIDPGDDETMRERMESGVRAFLEEPTIPAKEKVLFDITGLVASRFADRRSSRNRELIRRLEEYVDAHALDPEICHTMIADSMGMNPKYLARFFQEQTGGTISRRITDLRIIEARKHLRRGESVQTTAMKVGYSGAIAFIRAFKKHEGISPGRYSQESRGK